jgi:anaerobic magnesium-protoporphyrin IX monomethyl ester cyclase
MKILLIIYDNDSYISWFPQSSALIAKVCLNEGHQVEIYNQDIHHYSEEHLLDYLNQTKFDVIGLSFIAGYYQYHKVLKISEAINKNKYRSNQTFIIGGYGPSPEPEFFLKKTQADICVRGEGIETIKYILRGDDLKSIAGIAYRDKEDVYINSNREVIKNVDEYPLSAYELFPVEIYRLLRMPHCENRFVMPMLSGMGCPFHCNFCQKMENGYRIRSNESIIDEIKFLKKKYNIGYIAFSDELLMVNKSRTASLCESFLKENLDIIWDCNGRLNFCEPQLLELMKRAGCVFINFGIESFNNHILKKMGKCLNTDQIVKGVETTLQAGISPGLNLIFGNINEGIEELNNSVNFLLKYDNQSQKRTLRPVTPYPGSPLYNYCIEKGLILDAEDFYTNKHLNSDLRTVNLNPSLSDEEFYRALMEANKTLLNNYYDKQKEEAMKQCEDLYLNQNTNFRGFRQT